MSLPGLKNLKTILIDVNEQIDKKYIHDFILSSLTLNNIDYENKQVKYLYLSDSSKYQIFIYEKDIKYLFFEYFQKNYKKTSSSNDLYIFDKHLIVYKDESFYFYKELEYELKDEELNHYLKNILLLEIDNIYKYDYKKFEELILIKNKMKSSLSDFNKSKKSSFKYYLLYLLVIIIFSFLFYLYEKKEYEQKLIIQENKNKKLIDKIKNKHSFKPLFLEVNYLFDLIKKNKLKLESFEKKNNSLFLIVVSKKKNHIYKFLNEIEPKVLKSSLTFDTKNKVYRYMADVRYD